MEPCPHPMYNQFMDPFRCLICQLERKKSQTNLATMPTSNECFLVSPVNHSRSTVGAVEGTNLPCFLTDRGPSLSR
jgi:hypothetical protein